MDEIILRLHNDEEGLTRHLDVPPIVFRAGPSARFAYDEFFRATIGNDHTRRAYMKAVSRFLNWAEVTGHELPRIRPGDIGEYIKTLSTEARQFRNKRKQVTKTVRSRPASIPMQKLHLAALRGFFDLLVERHACVLNPAASVRGQKLSMTEGKTPAIDPAQATALLKGIDVSTVMGLRDRAIIGTLIYTAARVGAVSKLTLGDFYTDGKQYYLRLDEKNGKLRIIPCREDLREYIEAYATVGQFTPDERAPLFRSVHARSKQLTEKLLSAGDILRMVKRRFAEAGLPSKLLRCHTFRATTATVLLEKGVELAAVQDLLGHSDPRTTRLYDRRGRTATRNVVEKIAI